MSYAAKRANAYTKILAAGRALTVSRETPGATSDVAPTLTSVNVAAMAKRGDPSRYAALGLTLTQAVTLLTVPAADGLRAYTADFAKPGDTLSWNDVTFTVRDVGPLVALDGYVLLGTLVASV